MTEPAFENGQEVMGLWDVEYDGYGKAVGSIWKRGTIVGWGQNPRPGYLQIRWEGSGRIALQWDDQIKAIPPLQLLAETLEKEEEDRYE